MKAADFLRAAEALPIVDLARLTDGRAIVVIAPHPDDESLGCGGLIALARQAGIPVRLVVVSDGTGSHPNSPSHPASRLRRLRETETREAACALGLDPDAIRFLRLADRFVPAAGPSAVVAARLIAEEARGCGAGAMFVTWAHDPHCDHEATAAIARLALPMLSGGTRLLEYPVWGWSLPPDREVGEPPCGVRLDVSAVLPAKRRAILAHRSQTTDLIDDDPAGFRLSPGMIDRFTRPFEIFLHAGPATDHAR